MPDIICSMYLLKKNLVLIILFLTSLLPVSGQDNQFVTVKNHTFFVNGKPYFYVGANYWYGTLLGLEDDREKGVERLRKELDFLKANGVNNLRVMAGAEGSGMINGVQRVGPALQPEQGVFNERVLDGLDLLLDEMGKRDMKAVVFFSNNWEWSGGFQQYLIWNKSVPDSLTSRKLTWDEQRDIIYKFYTCEPCKDSYEEQVKLVLNRTNKYNKRKYIDDPAVMAWELANEPRPMRPVANEAYKHWIAEVAAMIKQQDSKHLVTIGHEGDMGSENMKLYEEIHADPNIDYLTIHIWPKNWSWFNGHDIAGGISQVIAKTLGYIDLHLPVAEKVNKPLVIEEFGLPRNGHSFAVAAETSLRDSFYNQIFSIIRKQPGINGYIAGANFWAFGGTARPVSGQIFWKRGDDYMGDPPMEEQGLNTVFDSDRTTWQIINNTTRSLNKQTGQHW